MSDSLISLQPKPGLLVRKPTGGHLSDHGERVQIDSYWRRRLADGDVTESLQFAEPEAKTAKAAK